MTEQKVSWAESLYVTSQQARETLPATIRDAVLVKCEEVARSGLVAHEFTLKDLDIKTLDKVEQGQLLDAAAKLLKEDGLEAIKMSIGSWNVEWLGLSVSWAKAKPQPKPVETPALKHDIEI
jgi:ketopantoate hydroxymethyltransferase